MRNHANMMQEEIGPPQKHIGKIRKVSSKQDTD